MKLRVYLDTSVLSALFDDRVPDRKAATEEFWQRRSPFEISTSELTRQELSQVPDAGLLSKFQKLLGKVEILPNQKEPTDN